MEAAEAGALTADSVSAWEWDTDEKLWEIDQQLWVSRTGATTMWAASWNWSDDQTYLGYLGLQTDGNRFDGSVGDMAIFSVWNARGGAGTSCQALEGDDSIWSCRLAFPVLTDRGYRLRLWFLENNATGQWWGAWIQDMTTGEDTLIGAIAVDPSHNAIAPLTGTSSYFFGMATDCSDIPASTVMWAPPVGNKQDGDIYTATGSFRDQSSTSSCPGSGAPGSVGASTGVTVTLGQD